MNCQQITLIDEIIARFNYFSLFYNYPRELLKCFNMQVGYFSVIYRFLVTPQAFYRYHYRSVCLFLASSRQTNLRYKRLTRYGTCNRIGSQFN